MRLEVIPHASLPYAGSGRANESGNFSLSELKTEAMPQSGTAPVQVVWARAYSDLETPAALHYAGKHIHIRNIIDGNASSYWEAWPASDKPHEAVLFPAAAVPAAAGDVLTFTLQFGPHRFHGLGQFRLSLSGDPALLEPAMVMRQEQRCAARMLPDPWLRLAAAYAVNGSKDEALRCFGKALQLADDGAGKGRVIAVAAAQPGQLENLAESTPNDGQFQAELARYYAERGNKQLADAALSKARALFEAELAKEPANATLAGELADLLLIDSTPRTVGPQPAGLEENRLADPRLKLFAAYRLIGRNGKASEYLGNALRADPKLGDDRESQYRYQAARAAVVAATAPDRDEPPQGDAAKAMLRGQALDWLTAELASWSMVLESALPQNRLLIVPVLTTWQNNHDLAGVRDVAALARLPAEEQKAFAQLWTEVAALSKQAEESATNTERLAVARIAYQRKQFATATRQWAKALANDPKLAVGRNERHRYSAASAAALAAAGQGQDEPAPDEAAKADLRAQALDWLTAELAVWDKLLTSGTLKDRQLIAQTLRQWQTGSDLASIRDAAALTKLRDMEQKAFAPLWADVAALLKKATAKSGP
jgi:tetratricopeptide (TPR) repeat protein